MLVQNAGADYNLTANNITELAHGKRNSEAKDIKENTQQHIVSTDAKITFNAKEKIHTNSGEKTNFH